MKKKISQEQILYRKTYFEPLDFVSKELLDQSIPGLLDHQFFGYNYFFKNTNFSLDRINFFTFLKELIAITSDTKKSYIQLLSYEFIENNVNLLELKILKKNYKSLLSVVRIKVLIQLCDRKIVEEFFLLNVPTITQNASFILNGVERTIFSKLSKNFGLVFRLLERNKLVCEVYPRFGSKISFYTQKESGLKIGYRGKVFPWLLILIYHKILTLRVFIVLFFFLIKDSQLVINNFKESFDNYFFIVLNSDFSIKSFKIILNFDELLMEVQNKNSRVYFVLKNKKFLLQTILEYQKFILNKSVNVIDQFLFDFLYLNEEKESIFNNRKFYLGKLARKIINYKLYNKFILTSSLFLTKEDLIAIVKKLIDIIDGKQELDNIDNLLCKRLSLIGENLINLNLTAFLYLRKKLSERINILELKYLNLKKELLKDSASILKTKNKIFSSDLKIVVFFFGGDYFQRIINSFFLKSSLSVFSNQTNALADISHKRRIVFVGSTGENKKRVSFEIRDVDPSIYGKICPIETPDGANIGLIGSLAKYTKVTEDGLLETPFFKVRNGKILLDKIIYLNIFDEVKRKIALPNTFKVNTTNFEIIDEKVECRINFSEVVLVNKTEVEYIDISSDSFLSLTSAFIPFLCNNDGNRASTAANMLKQVVPINFPEKPIVFTGEEENFSARTKNGLMAEDDGLIEYADSLKIIIKYKKLGIKEYFINNFSVSNQKTVFGYNILVRKGDKVKLNDILADISTSNDGIYSYGANLLTAYISKLGNFEDAIIISERLLHNETFSSFYIEELEVNISSTSLGNEKTSKNLSNIDSNLLEHLDDNGVVKVGSFVKSGDILVGKLTPLTTLGLSKEDKLLKSILGSSYFEYKNTSFKVPNGESGFVIKVDRIDLKENIAANKTSILEKIRIVLANKLSTKIGDKFCGRYGNKGIIAKILPIESMPFLEDGTIIDIIYNPLGVPSRMNVGQILELPLALALSKQGKRGRCRSFNIFSENDIKLLLKESGLPEDSRFILRDGDIGIKYKDRILCGIQYFVKLNHLVDHKIHARSIGNYALISQQPMGGRSLFGGQKLGPMAIWALEAYGVPNILNEMLILKSDDLEGRIGLYKSIVEGTKLPKEGFTESFKILKNYLQALCLNLELFNSEEKKIEV